MSICYTGSNMLVCALSFDSQLSCVFYLIKCIPIFSNVFPFSFFADSIINFPSLLDPTLKMWSQTWIEEVFLRIFNLQSRPGLKKFFWESSIFNPDLDWRSFSENLQSSIFNPDLDWRSFSENLQSSIFNPIHFAINCKPCLLVRTGCHLVHVYMYMYM